MTAQPTRYDQVMLRTMNREEARHWHATRTRRRAWTAAHAVLTAATLAVFPLAGSGVALLALLVPLILAWCVCTGVLNSATRGLLELRARALDERQLAERGRVHTLAHRTQLALLLAAGAALFLTDPSQEAMAVTGVALVLTHWLLPLWTAVLLAADEPGDDPVAA